METKIPLVQSVANIIDKAICCYSTEPDTESNRNVPGEIAGIDHRVERSLVRRLDLILLPTLCKTELYSFYISYLYLSIYLYKIQLIVE